MRSDFTDITVVMDRSGSMESCRDDAEGGINSFVEDQKKQDGDAAFTLVQFDHEYEFVHRGIPILDVPRLTLSPRGSTALLDAVGRAINETGDRLSKMAKAERPGLVAFVIITDGHENASKEFTRDKVKAMIDRQKAEYNWQFTFLGADANAFAEARLMGIARDDAAEYTSGKVDHAYSAASSKLGRMRAARASGQSVSDVAAFTDDERQAMKD